MQQSPLRAKFIAFNTTFEPDHEQKIVRDIIILRFDVGAIAMDVQEASELYMNLRDALIRCGERHYV